MSEQQSEQVERRVCNDLTVGTRVQFETWFPGKGRQEREGEIVEVHENYQNYVVTVYKVETGNGWARVSANKIVGVL